MKNNQINQDMKFLIFKNILLSFIYIINECLQLILMVELIVTDFFYFLVLYVCSVHVELDSVMNVEPEVEFIGRYEKNVLVPIG